MLRMKNKKKTQKQITKTKNDFLNINTEAYYIPPVKIFIYFKYLLFPPYLK